MRLLIKAFDRDELVELESRVGLMRLVPVDGGDVDFGGSKHSICALLPQGSTKDADGTIDWRSLASKNCVSRALAVGGRLMAKVDKFGRDPRSSSMVPREAN